MRLYGRVPFVVFIVILSLGEGSKKGETDIRTYKNAHRIKRIHDNMIRKKSYDDYDNDYNDDDDIDFDDDEENIGDSGNDGNFVGHPSNRGNNDETPQAEANLGHHYFQGDILSTRSQKTKLLKLLQHDRPSGSLQNRALIKDVDRTWKNGVVPYTIKPGATAEQLKMVTDAISHWESRTCLEFKPRKDEKDFLQFQRGDGCSSYVGRIGGIQTLTMGNKQHRCKLGNIIHELGHTIGFFHEQSRPDRDRFVKIKWKNVLKEYRVNFVKFARDVIDSKDVAYDYGSIMHYPRKIFGVDDRKETVTPKNADVYIGQRKGLSDKDIEQAKLLYKCR